MKTKNAANLWAKSKLVSKDAPLKKGVRPWDSLSDTDKKKFAAAFATDSAFKERRSVLLNGENLYLVWLLSAFQSGVEQEENGTPSRLEMEVRENLATHMLYEMIQGRWSSLRYLAKYGAKHAKKGLRNGKFPTVARLVENADKILAVRILRTFGELSGVSLEDLLLPPVEDRTAPPRLRYCGKANLLDPKFVPKGLPTKKLLLSTLEQTGGEVAAFSKQLKLVGLAGLPKSGKEE